ncbi:hypothetical protein ACIQCR_34820 [Streptomyces sp. NPDC093249]|uniref:hypothetical protein n=1 Tax=unclassified Streptomyces TaxID=2593676 RepID=UPI00344D54F0
MSAYNLYVHLAEAFMPAATATWHTYREATPRKEDQMSHQPAPASDGIAAYRHPDLAGALFCVEHGQGWEGLIPMTASEVPSIIAFCSWATDDDMTVCGRALPTKKTPRR